MKTGSDLIRHSDAASTSGVPAEPPFDRHGGNLHAFSQAYGIAESEILDFSANINPLGPPEWIRPLVSRILGRIDVYPDPDCTLVRDAIARKFNVSKNSILAGNGAAELIHVLPRAVNARRVVIPLPAYSGYARAARASAIETVFIEQNSAYGVDVDRLEETLLSGDLLFLGHPNNPAGIELPVEEIRALAASRPDVVFGIDEAFGDFDPDFRTLIDPQSENIVVIRSFTKLFALPGLRLGCVIASPRMIEAISLQLPDWSVNALAQGVGEFLFETTQEYLAATQNLIRENREWLVTELRRLPSLDVIDSKAPYLLCRITGGEKGCAQLADELLRLDAIAIRRCDAIPGLDRSHFRVAIKSAEENRRLVDALAASFTTGRHRTAFANRRKKNRNLMIQGITSNAGKSLLTAAFCRILLQDGFRVAPFKGQNMSLNSFVTATGEEIARAQAVQAAACRIAPDVRMSPVLLKPVSRSGSQVIVNGLPIGNMSAREYHTNRSPIFKEIKRNYDSLATDYDIIVLEGAGSPGEVNLKHNDVVNMRMAEHADAPVLIVGDIDRGGVFSGFVGTMEVLAEWERKRVEGFLINKFRGDRSLLDPALEYTRFHTGRPVLGVVPFLNDLRIPDEDSVSFKEHDPKRGEIENDTVKIGVVDLPYISNFTDFDPFRFENDVDLRIIRAGDSIDDLDAVILPGTKNTIHDMHHLIETGPGERLRSFARNGKGVIVGICGGLQMLGRTIRDPDRIESDCDEIAGLGLLEIETVFEIEKILRQTESLHLPTGLPVRGYEVHHGRTALLQAERVETIMKSGDEPIGFSGEEERVWGVYLHGIFDDDRFRRHFIDSLRARKGLPPHENGTTYTLEADFDRLAEVVRENVDMKEIYRIIGI